MKIIILLILILLIIVPQELINQDKLTNKLAGLESRLGAMERARQPYISDWYSLNVGLFTYSSATQITITDAYTLNLFRTGDKLKIIQGATTKYFYVMQVGANYINIYGGNSYTFTNTTISYIGYTRKEVVLSFPNYMTFTPVMSASGAMTVSGGSPTGYVSMSGSKVQIFMASIGMTLGGVASYDIYASLPWLPLFGNSYGILYEFMPAYITENNANKIGIVSIDNVNNRLFFEPLTVSGNWTLGAGVATTETVYNFVINN
jgi:hypothetical protein